MVQQAEFGVERGQGGIEVSLVAALPETVEPAPVQELPKTVEEKDDEMIVQETVEVKKAASLTKGDGSSLVPGTDATTLSSSGGAWTEAKPSYLKNPAPPYPEKARQLGQEGLVILWAAVNKNGTADEIKIRQSSGFSLLDEAALKAVRRWKFQPARVGALPVDSNVEVPIRFRLEDK